MKEWKNERMKEREKKERKIDKRKKERNEKFIWIISQNVGQTQWVGSNKEQLIENWRNLTLLHKFFLISISFVIASNFCV